jgi:hypothetical protein
MDSWLPLVMLALAGFLIGGVISFAKSGRPKAAAVLGVGVFLCLIATFLWWQPT